MGVPPVARTFRGDHLAPGIVCDDPTLAIQSSKDECDINVIVKRYLRTGELPGLREGVYADISHLTGLQDAIHMVNAAEDAFMSLPADVRSYFDNDPVKLVAFAQDPANLDKARELGLAPPPAPPVIPPPSQPGAGGAPVVAPAPAPAPKP